MPACTTVWTTVSLMFRREEPLTVNSKMIFILVVAGNVSYDLIYKWKWHSVTTFLQKKKISISQTEAVTARTVYGMNEDEHTLGFQFHFHLRYSGLKGLNFKHSFWVQKFITIECPVLTSHRTTTSATSISDYVVLYIIFSSQAIVTELVSSPNLSEFPLDPSKY